MSAPLVESRTTSSLWRWTPARIASISRLSFASSSRFLVKCNLPAKLDNWTEWIWFQGSKFGFVRSVNMRLHFLCSLLLGVVISSAGTAASHHRHGHPNATQVVPSDWQVEQSDPNWRGHKFVSPDGSSWFSAYSTPADHATRVDAMTTNPGEQITYQKREGDWGVVSGFKGDKIFYRKAVLACGGKVWHEIAFEYPADRKREMDSFVIRASRSIDHAENDSCVGPMRGRYGD